jgi:transposase InsO family protein
MEVATARRKPAPGFERHSDRRVVRYTALSFDERQKDESLLTSMGRAMSTLDIALTESFVVTLKTELRYLVS